MMVAHTIDRDSENPGFSPLCDKTDVVQLSERSFDCANLPKSLKSTTSPHIHGAYFVGKHFNISDGTRWQIRAPLSHITLQQVFSPCEARQVYTATCVDEPWKSYGEVVVKVKFQ
jgi:hypothetical protein